MIESHWTALRNPDGRECLAEVIEYFEYWTEGDGRPDDDREAKGIRLVIEYLLRRAGYLPQELGMGGTRRALDALAGAVYPEAMEPALEEGPEDENLFDE